MSEAQPPRILPKSVSTTHDVALDWTKCFAYEALISEEIEHYSEIEVTQDLKEGGLQANHAWERYFQYLTALWQTNLSAEIANAARRFQSPRILSLGCGYGGMELDAARHLAPPYELHAIDINERLFSGARTMAERDGLNVTFQALDLNFIELEENSFDVIFAHSSLHHLLNFEHIFQQVYKALSDSGRFIVLDIIGKTQVLFWPENVDFAARLVAEMPEPYRPGLAADPKALFPAYTDGALQEGMEGIRQEEMEQQIEYLFHPLEKFKYNAFVRLICTHGGIAPNFDVSRAEDLAALESLYRLDQQEIAAGRLRATEMFAVYEKKPRRELPAAPGGWAVPRNDVEVTVCVIVEKRASSLQTCLESVRAQTHSRIELLLLKPDDNARAVLETARGKYVAVLNSDDAWFPVKLAEQVAFLEDHNDVGLVYAPAIVVDERGRYTSRAYGSEIWGDDISRNAAERLKNGFRFPRSSALFRKSLAGASVSFNEQDILSGIARTARIAFQERPLSMMRVREETREEPVRQTRMLDDFPRRIVRAIRRRLRGGF